MHFAFIERDGAAVPLDGIEAALSAECGRAASHFSGKPAESLRFWPGKCRYGNGSGGPSPGGTSARRGQSRLYTLRPGAGCGAFTLVELLVVMCIIAILTAIAMPIASGVLDSGRKAACISNLRQIGIGIAAYASDNDNQIPYGPKAPPFTSPSDLYPSTGAPTSLISLRTGTPVALGLLLDQYLAKTPKVLFCPGCDKPLDANAELAKVGKTQAQGGYYYRHGGNTTVFDNPKAPFQPQLRLQALGDNRNGVPVRALVMDSMYTCPPGLEQFNVMSRTSHHQKYANILYSDGHVASNINTNNKYGVDISDYSQLYGSFDMVLASFEKADADIQQKQ